MLRFLKWIAVGLGTLIATLIGILVLAVVLIVAFFDLNTLREPLSTAVSKSLGRDFSINGDLSADWSLTPRFTINDVELANAPWGSEPEMFTLDRLAFAVRIPDLFKGRIVLPEIRVSKPRMLLERNPEGMANWEFGDKDKKEERDRAESPISERWFPKIDSLAIDDGRLLFRDPTMDTQLDMNVSTAVGESDEQAVELNGQGRLQQEQFTLKVRGGSVLDLWKEEQPFPVNVEVAYGKTEAKVAGTIAEPLQLQGPDLRFEAKGPDLAALAAVVPVWIPETPPYRFRGKINREGERWLLKGFEGNLGNSDLTGDLTFMMRKDRPYLVGDVVSRKLDFKDFVGIFGADPTPSPEEPERPRLLPDKPYPVEGLRTADGDIRFQSKNIVTPWMPVDDVFVDIKMDRGMLTIQPAKLTVGYGAIDSNVTVNARGEKLQTEVKGKIDKVPFKRLAAGTPFEQETAGTFFGRLHLTTEGNSVAEMAAHADGGITILMEQGRISNLMMELLGVDIAESLQKLIGKDPSIPVRCTIADFIISDGVVKTQLFLMDTTDTNVLLEGQVNLATEALDLRLSAHPKDFSPFSARTPIKIGGNLKKPRPYPEPAPLAGRAAASVALGALLTPAAALIPWVELGLAEDSQCHALIDAASTKEKIPKKEREQQERP
ncbi:AsmA family protein [Methylocaldum sp.]|uniref:AsmA family protein n=1 Tax=Methylocaldum sp. TaxID=1969727 RepID=UPI002D64BC52|nr:AsmA family protein [Methylocaldum sp.]HYE37412.1 AsmA family protein [Methylocaldum sp.]